jgi:hypothetical protein
MMFVNTLLLFGFFLSSTRSTRFESRSDSPAGQYNVKTTLLLLPASRGHRFNARRAVRYNFTQGILMKCVVQAVLGMSLLAGAPAFSASAVPAASATVATPAHVQAVQELLAAMQIQKSLWGVASRSRYASEAQRQAVVAKIDKTPAATVYQRLAPPLAQVISSATAAEMTRFYNTPYGKQVIHKKYNGTPEIQMPGMRASVPAEEKKERKRPAYVQASKELADAQPVIDRELFKVVQAIGKEQR